MPKDLARNKTYTAKQLRSLGYGGVVGDAPDDATYFHDTGGGWHQRSGGRAGGGGGGAQPPSTPPTTPGGPIAPGGGGGGGMDSQVSMDSGSGGGGGTGTTLNGMSRFRQGIGQRTPPSDSLALAALRKIY